MRSTNNLIRSTEEREIRRAHKREAVISFLREHIWSTQDILQQVLMHQSRQATHKSLRKIEAEQLIRRHVYPHLGGKLTLWGITPHGQAMAFDPGNQKPISAYFEPSRIGEQGMQHHLDLQHLRLKAEGYGWKEWVDGDRIGRVGKDGRRPDAIALDPQGRLTAIECERTIKTLKRYDQILASYLRAIKVGTFSRVVWVAPTAEIAARLRVIITGIRSVNVSGQRVAVEPDRHHAQLFFTHYGQWPVF